MRFPLAKLRRSASARDRNTIRPGELLQTLRAIGVQQFFKQQQNVVIVSTTHLHRAMTGALEITGVAPRETPHVTASDVSQHIKEHRQELPLYVVADLEGREASTIARIEKRAPGRAIGLMRDICLPRLVGVESAEAIDRNAPLPQRTFAITCTPRSGSTYLSSLLSKLDGGGLPAEHLRQPAVFFTRHREALGFNFEQWVDAVLRCHSRDGVFSTKIISHFMFDLMKFMTPADLRHVQKRLGNSRVVYLVRQNKHEQAVSGFFAKHTTKWHLKSQTEAERYSEAKRRLEYNFERIKWQYDYYVKMEAELLEILKRSGVKWITFAYEDLLREPQRIINEILTFVNDGSNQNVIEIPQADVLRIFDEVNEAYAMRFADELAASRNGELSSAKEPAMSA